MNKEVVCSTKQRGKYICRTWLGDLRVPAACLGKTWHGQSLCLSKLLEAVSPCKPLHNVAWWSCDRTSFLSASSERYTKSFQTQVEKTLMQLLYFLRRVSLSVFLISLCQHIGGPPPPLPFKPLFSSLDGKIKRREKKIKTCCLAK